MESASMGRAWIELDRQALAWNLEQLRGRLPQGCEPMPAVKANAYGHGAALIAPELERLGVRAFCVASVQEGAALRQSGVKGDILVLGYSHDTELALAMERDLILTVTGPDHAERLRASGLPLRVHLAVDTGMHRLGVAHKALNDLERLWRMESLRPEGLYTHLCTEDRVFSARQAERFWAAVRALQSRGCAVGKAHLLSSHSLLTFPELGGDYARVGIALYGPPGFGPEAALRPVLSLKARITAVRPVKKGEGAGYGLRYRAGQDAQLAALAIGYADGLPRSLSCGRGSVLINGHAAPVAGNVCMDQTLVDVTDFPGVQVGGEAVLIGCSGERELTVCAMAQAAGTIPNEILSRLGPRLERTWKD